MKKIWTLGKIGGTRRRGKQRTNSRDMSLSKLQEIVEDRGAQHATVPGVAKSQIQLRD